MTHQQLPSKALLVTLWVAQVLLASGMLFGSMKKLFQPIEELSLEWPWVGEVPVVFLKFTGAIDLLGVLGLILPALLRIRPNVTPMAAIGIIVLMICASVFHISRGEGSLIGVNIFFMILAIFIAWGRLSRVPIAPK